MNELKLIDIFIYSALGFWVGFFILSDNWFYLGVMIPLIVSIITYDTYFYGRTR